MEMHVDGFRFDLAPILTRACRSSALLCLWDFVHVYGNRLDGDLLTIGTPLSSPPVLDMISNDPILQGMKLKHGIVEASTKLASFLTGVFGLNGMERSVHIWQSPNFLPCCCDRM
ncbi:Isoamylase su1, chloroplastic [Ancistrocladus abbreviatus]